MYPVLFYILMGCMIAIFMVDNPKLEWMRMTKTQIIMDIIMCAALWPIFTAGVIYGFFKGRRK